MNRLLRVYCYAGVFFVAAVYLTSLMMWLDATFSGGYYVVVYTNRFGEHWLELGLLFCFLPLVFYACASVFARLVPRRDDRQRHQSHLSP